MLERIADLLKQELRVEPSLLGPGAVERAVRERQGLRKLTDIAAYWALLVGSAEERQALIDAVVVPETWFFRDRGAFDALLTHVLPEWQRAQPLVPLRVLSLPCSTGEEAYSLAMALLDAGLETPAFRIDAVDVSERSLSVARSALYRRNSFRGRELDFRERHFHARQDDYQLRAQVAACVQFRRGNLFDLEQGSTAYDVVFCRNLLIYFDRPMQDRALRVLRHVLKPTGILFLGPAEAALALTQEWAPLKAPLSFAFRPAPPQEHARTKPKPAHKQAPIGRKPTRPLVRRANAAPQGRPAEALPPAPPSGVDASRAEAARLADMGRYAEAAERCEALLRQHPSDAPVLFLLGVVREAQGQSGAAAQCFRKTLYLEPGHQDAMHHYAMLLERQGDERAAQALRERALRRSAAGETRR